MPCIQHIVQIASCTSSILCVFIDCVYLHKASHNKLSQSTQKVDNNLGIAGETAFCNKIDDTIQIQSILYTEFRVRRG